MGSRRVARRGPRSHPHRGLCRAAPLGPARSKQKTDSPGSLQPAEPPEPSPPARRAPCVPNAHYPPRQPPPCSQCSLNPQRTEKFPGSTPKPANPSRIPRSDRLCVPRLVSPGHTQPPKTYLGAHAVSVALGALGRFPGPCQSESGTLGETEAANRKRISVINSLSLGVSSW